jgi:hypothetical protein
MTVKTGATVKVPTITRTAYLDALEVQAKAAAAKAKALRLASAKAELARHEGSMADAVTLVASLRAVVLAHPENTHLRFVKSALTSVESAHNETRDYYLNDARHAVKNIEGGNVTDDSLI